MEKCEFDNIEVIDGYFSGVASIFDNKKRYIVDISYDIEFEKLQISNCTDAMYNSNMEKYDIKELEELKIRNYYALQRKILDFIETNGNLVFADH